MRINFYFFHTVDEFSIDLLVVGLNLQKLQMNPAFDGILQLFCRENASASTQLNKPTKKKEYKITKENEKLFFCERHMMEKSKQLFICVHK